ncbi:protein FAR1-RELATED SEQUENCE 5 [Glycine max]|uniref:protein FAR1-RELATED SEQUENCE 5 n=1 Tax=Glycine max TaxID=3847 RepID=UPI0003DE8783|nr:protein FAR1-RELATED SEQUENCE 5 [Glycine max]|eukprot:XP_006582641.1 protein FAR1-RELATED SEQUENCE 5 [Glycine max]
MNGYDYKNLRKLVPENQVDPVLNISKQKKRKRVKDSPKVNLGGVSKHFDGRDFVGDDVGFNIGKVVQQDQVADLTKQIEFGVNGFMLLVKERLATSMDFSSESMDLDAIMSELETTDNFRSFVNGDGANDDGDYENDDDYQDDVGVQDEEEVDSELQNEDDGDYDEFWIPGHRKMSASDIMQVENYRKVGIRPPHMYAAFANQCGGYEKVGFIRKDIYNEEGCMRRQHSSDARGALKYLYDLCKKEPMMYVSCTADEESRLQRLFWSDTESQLLYQVFGDVLAFDATYKKNKYLCPVVVFSGVNHHNQTIVFVAAIVTDETEETYVWLLEQLLVAMKGKAPCSIITDGDLAMRNVITRVMLGVSHRLCAWHLLRNALSHVRDKHVLKWLKKLMLGDFEVVEFEEKWKEMVATFELEDNSWIAELYEKRMKWSTAHLRGHFFAGIRTTSRCEAFHAHVAKYVHSRTNLTDFVEQFQRFLTYFRYRAVVADYSSTYGKEVLQTNLRSLERSGDELFTKEMFQLFQSYLCRTIKLRVVDCKDMATFSVFTIVKYCSGSVWRVSYCPSTIEFTCTCMRMQSIGLPCDHILAVLVSLNFMELPSSSVLNRWSKLATKQIKDKYPDSAMYWDSQLMGRYATLVEVSREVCAAAYRDEEEYDKMLHFLSNEATRMKSKQNSEHCVDDNQTHQQDDDFAGILDPVVVRSKGCGQVGMDESGRQRRIQKCRQCGGIGHNKRSCTNHPRNVNGCMSSTEQTSSMLQATHENYSEVEPQTQSFVAGSSRVGLLTKIVTSATIKC